MYLNNKLQKVLPVVEIHFWLLSWFCFVTMLYSLLVHIGILNDYIISFCIVENGQIIASNLWFITPSVHTNFLVSLHALNKITQMTMDSRWAEQIKISPLFSKCNKTVFICRWEGLGKTPCVFASLWRKSYRQTQIVTTLAYK